MIRECFKLKTGIIFDAHMLREEVGLDIDSISDKPPLRLEGKHLDLTPPDGSELKGFSLSTVPVAVGSAIISPFRWTWRKVSHLFSKNPPKVPFTLENTKRLSYAGEAQEELEDALTPIYDQLNKHTYWKVMEWIPWIIKKQGAEEDGSQHFWDYKFVWNRGKGRKVYHQVMHRGMKVHRSVKTRMESKGMKGKNRQYRPEIRCFIEGESGPRRLTREEWLGEMHFKWVD